MYIDFNTNMRSKATSPQENLRNRINVEVITDRDVALKMVYKPNFKRSYTIHEDLTVMEMRTTKLKSNKCVYVGFSVLEISKLWMYQLHYDCMLKWFDNILLCRHG